MSSVVEPVRLMWRHRGMLLRTTANDIRARYAGSTLGLAWLLLYPLLFLSVYALVWWFIYRQRLELLTSKEYVVFIFTGLLPFIGFVEVLTSGVTSVTANASLIKNTLFPIELVPVKTVLVGQCTQAMGTVILIFAIGVVGHLSAWILLFPVVWLLQLAFMLGMTWVLSSLNVYLRDLQNVVAILPLILMAATPIAWPPGVEIPPKLLWFLGFNPLYYIVVAYQECMFQQRFPAGGVFWVLLGMSLVVFLFGCWFFGRMKMVFADNV